MSYFEDYDEYDSYIGTAIQPKCYRCGEKCYWENKQLYDFDIDEVHICKDKMLATANEFED